MSDIAICGGGIGGLLTAMLLAADGHEITVLERDPGPVPRPGDAWNGWERRGVNQFRLPHFLIPAFRQTAEAELPALVPALEAAGAYRFNPLSKASGGHLNDPDLDVVTARRPVAEAVVAKLAEDVPGVTVRRGTGIAGLVSAPERDGVPHVKGVVTDRGEKLEADVVLDCTGRRSPLSGWLKEIGCPAIEEEKEDSGFVYYGCHIRSRDGSPFPLGPGMTYAGSVGVLVLPAEDGTAGVGIITASGDAPLRALRRDSPWQAAMRLLPGGAEILDAERVSPLVSMASIEDRWCRTARDGRPVATGVLAVGDAWAATNPTLGRGIPLGFRHAVALRNTLREHADHPRGLAEAFDAVTQEHFTPWYRSTIWHDRHRVADLRAAANGGPPRTDDPSWQQWLDLGVIANSDSSVVGPFLNSVLLLGQTPEMLLQERAIQETLAAHSPEQPPQPGPSREVLLKAVADAA